MRTLSEAGVPVAVNAAPVIPGLNDEEIPAILRAAREHGASWASYTILRLPGAVEGLFLGWLKREMPERASKIVTRLRDMRGGALSESHFGKRMKGQGEFAGTIRQLFRVQARACAFREDEVAFDLTRFTRRRAAPQGDLFESGEGRPAR
jgi:DNA repair photolyase